MRRPVVLLALLLMVAAPMAEAHAQSAPLRVSMVGDSVMLGARDQLLARFPDASVTVDAVEDRSLLGAVGLLQAAQDVPSDVVVLDLGYNDADDPAEFRRRIDAAMAVLTAVPKVIWLNQREFAPGRAGMNAELVAAATRYGNLDVVDWNAEVAAHPDDVYADGIHLTAAGQSAMASLVRQRFDAFVASRTPATTTSATAPTTTPITAKHRGASARVAVTGSPADVASSTPDRTGWLALGAGAALVVLGAFALAARRWLART